MCELLPVTSPRGQGLRRLCAFKPPPGYEFKPPPGYEFKPPPGSVPQPLSGTDLGTPSHHLGLREAKVARWRAFCSGWSYPAMGLACCFPKVLCVRAHLRNAFKPPSGYPGITCLNPRRDTTFNPRRDTCLNPRRDTCLNPRRDLWRLRSRPSPTLLGAGLCRGPTASKHGAESP